MEPVRAAKAVEAPARRAVGRAAARLQRDQGERETASRSPRAERSLPDSRGGGAYPQLYDSKLANLPKPLAKRLKYYRKFVARASRGRGRDVDLVGVYGVDGTVRAPTPTIPRAKHPFL